MWTNNFNTTNVPVGADVVFDPCKVAQHHTDIWKSIWKSGGQDIEDKAFNTAKQAREDALVHCNHDKGSVLFNADSITDAAKSFKKHEASGSNAQFFVEIANATPDARAAMAGIMKMTLATRAWPIPVLLVWMGLLGKRAGGTHTIAIIAAYARLFLPILKPEVRT